MEKERDIVILSAESFLRAPAVDTSIALRVHSITPSAAGEVRAKLVRLYGGDTALCADGKSCAAAAIPDGVNEVEAAALCDFDKPGYNVVDARRIIARLMQKPGGCPWDSVQTHESIRINMIEEAYEAVDAIDSGDRDNMIEEFGDVLMQSLLQSEIAKRDGEFDFDEVCDMLCKKLITRHSFIFGADSASSADDAITLWDKNKAVEKHYDSLKAQLERLPGNFPALLYSQKVYKKSAKAGVRVDPETRLSAALAAKDYAGAINALAAMLSDEGKDAEVELNKLVKAEIAGL